MRFETIPKVTRSTIAGLTVLIIAIVSLPSSSLSANGLAATSGENATWEVPGDEELSARMRIALDLLGLSASDSEQLTSHFDHLLQTGTSDPLDAWVGSLSAELPIIETVMVATETSPLEMAKSLDPGADAYQAIEALPEAIRMSVRTWIARELVRGRFFDEALPVIAEVDPTLTADPAAALFYRGVCYHSLRMKKEALADLRRLLEQKDNIPRRYYRTASMMISDIKPLEEDSLDEIARLMTDVSRRLDLGRTNAKVEENEQLIIDKLTKMIEELEEQQKKQQSQQSAGGGGSGGSGGDSPASESEVSDVSGDGDVDRKKVGQTEGWGNLPPAKRKEAIQQISRDLPTHYRDAIEAYFRKLAKTE